MATDRAFAELVTAQLGSLEITTCPMFGEYAIYCRGKVFGLICDNTLFVKITPAGERFAGRIGRGAPYPGAKPHFRVSKQRLADDAWLTTLVTITTDALPEPKPRRKTTRKAQGRHDG